MISTKKKILVGLAIAVFGTFYSFISDTALSLANLIPDVPQWQLKLIASISVFLIVFSLGYGLHNIVRLAAKKFGFREIKETWLPTEIEQRIKETRKHIYELTKNTNTKIGLATVTGDWDMIRPFSDTELSQLLNQQKTHIQLLLSHPDSEGLREHCEQEGSQDLMNMRKKICRNTRKFIALGGDLVKVKWTLERPTFHIMANNELMHVGFYPIGKRGHASKRYVIGKESEMYIAMQRWFNEQWKNALEAEHEIEWVEKEILRDKAVFIDRDNTIIKDVGYSSNLNNTEIEILPNAVKGLKLLSETGYRLIIISNQQAIGLDLISKSDLYDFTKRMKKHFAEHDVYFDAIYYCTHRENEQCNCRKPKPQLFKRAIKKFSLDKNKCHMIGDSECDIKIKEYLPMITVHKVTSEKDILKIAKNIIS